MKKKTKAMLVEGCPDYRQAVAGIMECASDMELISTFSTADAALRSLQQMSTRQVPDLILLDLCLPGMPGLEALPYFKQYMPEIKIIIITHSDADRDVMNAVIAGIDGYLLKSTPQKKMIENIQSVINGGVSIDSAVAGFLFDAIRKTHEEKHLEIKLSSREQEVLGFIAEGMMMKEIAAHLGLGTATICTHAKHIYDKMDVTNAPSAVHKAYLTGILSRG